MSDEGVHEIQLNGKQLVFMFMAVTVVAVVIFLCGVMVGRGVRAPRATELADAVVETTTDPTAAVQAPAPPSADAPSSTAALSYPERLTPASTTPPEALKEPEEVKAAVNTSRPAVNSKTVAASKSASISKPAASEPEAGGYVVQVAAYKVRGEADTVAKRLASKGFPSFVTSPSAGAARMYRVRVGKYSDRREAEAVARRLEKEEQFKPWITR